MKAPSSSRALDRSRDAAALNPNSFASSYGTLKDLTGFPADNPTRRSFLRLSIPERLRLRLISEAPVIPAALSLFPNGIVNRRTRDTHRLRGQGRIRKEREGFTLAELLIVVAIIAVLVAIAIPVFNAQLEKSRDATDAANVRAAYAEAQADYILKDENNRATTYIYKIDGKSTDDKWAQNNSTTLEIGGLPVEMKKDAKRITFIMDADKGCTSIVLGTEAL